METREYREQNWLRTSITYVFRVSSSEMSETIQIMLVISPEVIRKYIFRPEMPPFSFVFLNIACYSEKYDVAKIGALE